MGLFESTVKTVYKADTKQMRSELKKLSKEQQVQAKAAIEASEKQNDAVDRQIAMLGKVAVAAAAVTGAYMAAKVGLEAYEKRSRLSSATVGVNLEGLQKATKGLVSETQLLEFASKAMNGTFKLSQAQMEQAMAGAVALRKTLGVDLQKALEVTTKSITEGTTEPLKELGLVVKGVENDTREGLNAALKELAEQARLAGPDLAIPGDEMAKSQVAMTDAVENLKISLGKLAQSLAPVIAKLAHLVSLLAQASEYTFGGSTVGDSMAEARRRLRGKSLGDTEVGYAGQSAQRAGYDRLKAGLGQAGSAFASAYRAGPPKTGGSKRSGSGGGYTLGNSSYIEDGLDIDPGGYTGANSSGHGALAAGNREALVALESVRGASDGVKEAIKAAAEFQKSQGMEKANMLAGIFGTPTEIDATAEALMALTSGFDSLAGAFGSGVDALITGSSSFAEAFKKAIGESLRSMAVDMSIRALREAAMGIGELALGNVPAAALHGKAALAYGVGAVAAGAAARTMGAGQVNTSAPKTAGSAGVGSSGAGASNDNGGKTVVQIIGNDFAGMNARQREAMWRQTSRSAGVQIEGDVVING